MKTSSHPESPVHIQPIGNFLLSVNTEGLEVSPQELCGIIEGHVQATLPVINESIQLQHELNVKKRLITQFDADTDAWIKRRREFVEKSTPAILIGFLALGDQAVQRAIEKAQELFEGIEPRPVCHVPDQEFVRRVMDNAGDETDTAALNILESARSSSVLQCLAERVRGVGPKAVSGEEVTSSPKDGGGVVGKPLQGEPEVQLHDLAPASHMSESLDPAPGGQPEGSVEDSASPELPPGFPS